ncbi:MAG: polysaccharide deacetylase family protein [Flavobacteriaceae bacterium]|nr:polysaccharide deacetylase family protein [Flavobacteriaceae bacterium]
MKVLFYTSADSSRLRYVLDFISKLIGIHFVVSFDSLEFENANIPKINYSTENLGGIQIKPHGLLFQNSLQKFEFDELETDELSMIFFLLSRYEEYLDFEPDTFGRFQAKFSYLHKTERMQIPYADVLVYEIKEKLLKSFPEIKFKENQYEKILTIDIDQAFKFQYKSFKRFVGGAVKDLLKFKVSNLLLRNLSYFGLKKDPWNIYSKIEEKMKNKPVIFFFQCGEYGEFDKNLPISQKAFRTIIRSVNSWALVGLHPSFQSNKDVEILKMEKRNLENVLGKNVSKSRQHYIKLEFPKTYQNLLSTGVYEDYSMGFPDEVGFRAGTCHPFFWYDLSKETQTSLLIHPFCVMDVTLKDYKNMREEHVYFILKNLESEVKKVNGKLYLVCHNESLSGHREWEKWDEVFFEFLHS